MSKRGREELGVLFEETRKRQKLEKMEDEKMEDEKVDVQKKCAFYAEQIRNISSSLGDRVPGPMDMCVFSRERGCIALTPKGTTGQAGWEQFISALLTILVIVPSILSPSLAEFPVYRDRILSSSLVSHLDLYGILLDEIWGHNQKAIGFSFRDQMKDILSGKSPFPKGIDLGSRWEKEWNDGGGDVTVFWGTVGVLKHAIAYRIDLNDRSVEVFDSNGWDHVNLGAYNILFEEGARFIRDVTRGEGQVGDDGPIFRFLVNPFPLPHTGSCGPWTAVYFLFRATLSREQTIRFFESAPEAGNIGGVYGEEDFEVGSLSRVVFLCLCRIWHLCYQFIDWSSLGEEKKLLLGQDFISMRAQPLMRVICGCQTYEQIRATLKTCLTPVGSLLPEPFRARLGIQARSRPPGDGSQGEDIFEDDVKMMEGDPIILTPLMTTRLFAGLRFAQKRGLEAVSNAIITYLCPNGSMARSPLKSERVEELCNFLSRNNGNFDDYAIPLGIDIFDRLQP